MQRYGQVIGLKPERYEEYAAAHAAVWPGVLAQIRDANIRNYSIFSFGEQLFAYFEYVGDDFAATSEGRIQRSARQVARQRKIGVEGGGAKVSRASRHDELAI